MACAVPKSAREAQTRFIFGIMVCVASVAFWIEAGLVLCVHESAQNSE